MYYLEQVLSLFLCGGLSGDCVWLGWSLSVVVFYVSGVGDWAADLLTS
jgi:hypothetical protein